MQVNQRGRELSKGKRAGIKMLVLIFSISRSQGSQIYEPGADKAVSIWGHRAEAFDCKLRVL